MTALLVTGAGGQLGTELVRLASTVEAWSSVLGFRSAELDITDAQAVRDTVASAVDSQRDVVVLNAAAYTAVDAAESDVDAAFAVNAVAPGVLAAACAERGATLIHISTDYVFSGDASRPYEADEATRPRSVYGRSKLAGERAVLSSTAHGYVVRTAWLYGATGSNFVATMVRLAASSATVSVVDDQRGSPTSSADLARGLLELAAAADRVPRGVLHCTNAGDTTWYGLARAVFEEVGADPDRVRPCTSAEYPRPAPRPAYSVLSPASWIRAGLTPLRPWREALSAAFASGAFAPAPSTEAAAAAVR